MRIHWKREKEDEGGIYLTYKDISKLYQLYNTYEADIMKYHLQETKHCYTKKTYNLLVELVNSNDLSNLLMVSTIISKIPRKKKK